MVNVGKPRFWMCLGLVLLLGCLLASSVTAGLFRSSKPKKKAAPPTFVVGSLVVFPFDQTGVSKVPETLGSDLASALRTGLGGHAKCYVYLYNERFPQVKRAKDDQEIKANEEAPPFSSDKAKTLKLARLLGADYYLAGALEDYQMDDATKTAQLTVSAELINVKSGKLMKSLLVTGRTPDSSTRSEEDEARALAAGEVVAKLKAQLTDEAKESATTAPAAAQVSK